MRLSPRVRQGLLTLLDAADYAEELQCDPWQFAVELSGLRGQGLSTSDLRWLMAKGLVMHAEEITTQSSPVRVFRAQGQVFSMGTCFILSPEGKALLQDWRLGGDRGTAWEEPFHFLPEGTAVADFLPRATMFTPQWDADRQELRVGSKLVKRYKVPAANQQVVLAAFQEENWPPRIDDPLPPQPGQEPKRRLHDTINSLNRHQVCALIRFQGDGRGRGVRWEFAGPAA